MKNITKRIAKGLCVFALLATIIPPMKIAAASAYVSASATTIYVGESVTFSIGVTGGAGYLNVSGAASDYAWIENGSKSYTVTGNSVGTLTVLVSGVIADYDTEKDFNVSDSASVNVIARPSKPADDGNDDNNNSNNNGNNGSSNNGDNGNNNNDDNSNNNTKEEPKETKKNTDSSLSSLSVSSGKLSPAFSKDVTSYKVTLDANVTKLSVQAKATNAKASVSGTGEKEVKPGNNTIKVTGTAEDGSTTTYTIKAYVNEKPIANIDYNDQSLGILSYVKDAPSLSKAFSEKKITVDDVEVTAWENEAMKITLLYLQDATGKNYYIYDETSKKIVSIYKPIALLGLNLVQIDVPSNMRKRTGMTFTEVEVDKQTLPGWKFNDKTFENFVVIYMMDESGTKHFYQYEKTGNRLQLFSGAAALTQEAYEKQLKEQKQKEQTLTYILYGTSAGCGVLLITTLFFAFRKKTKRSTGKRVKIQKENYEDRFPS